MSPCKQIKSEIPFVWASTLFSTHCNLDIIIFIYNEYCIMLPITTKFDITFCLQHECYVAWGVSSLSVMIPQHAGSVVEQRFYAIVVRSYWKSCCMYSVCVS